MSEQLNSIPSRQELNESFDAAAAIAKEADAASESYIPLYTGSAEPHLEHESLGQFGSTGENRVYRETTTPTVHPDVQREEIVAEVNRTTPNGKLRIDSRLRTPDQPLKDYDWARIPTQTRLIREEAGKETKVRNSNSPLVARMVAGIAINGVRQEASSILESAQVQKAA